MALFRKLRRPARRAAPRGASRRPTMPQRRPAARSAPRPAAPKEALRANVPTQVKKLKAAAEEAAVAAAAITRVDPVPAGETPASDPAMPVWYAGETVLKLLVKPGRALANLTLYLQGESRDVGLIQDIELRDGQLVSGPGYMGPGALSPLRDGTFAVKELSPESTLTVTLRRAFPLLPGEYELVDISCLAH